MTCIVGIAWRGSVFIGGDSAAVTDELIATRGPKVFQVGDMLVGFAGSYRAAQVLQYGIELPNHPDDMSDIEWLSTLFVDGLRSAHRRAGAIRIEAGIDGSTIALLLGYRGGLYEVDGEYAVSHVTGHSSVGSGASVALGALHATRKGKDPRKRVLIALEAAAACCNGVRAPFAIMKI